MRANSAVADPGEQVDVVAVGPLGADDRVVVPVAGEVADGHAVGGADADR